MPNSCRSLLMQSVVSPVPRLIPTSLQSSSFLNTTRWCYATTLTPQRCASYCSIQLANLAHRETFLSAQACMPMRNFGSPPGMMEWNVLGLPASIHPSMIRHTQVCTLSTTAYHVSLILKTLNQDINQPQQDLMSRPIYSANLMGGS